MYNVLSWREHLLSLFFSDLSKLCDIKERNHYIFISVSTLSPSMATFLKAYRINNTFYSGANHAIHPQLMVQASIFSDSHKIGLLHGAGTCFTTCYFAMQWLLRLKRALQVTIHGPAFESVSKNDVLSWILKILKIKFCRRVLFAYFTQFF